MARNELKLLWKTPRLCLAPVLELGRTGLDWKAEVMARGAVSGTSLQACWARL